MFFTASANLSATRHGRHPPRCHYNLRTTSRSNPILIRASTPGLIEQVLKLKKLLSQLSQQRLMFGISVAMLGTNCVCSAKQLKASTAAAHSSTWPAIHRFTDSDAKTYQNQRLTIALLINLGPIDPGILHSRIGSLLLFWKAYEVAKLATTFPARGFSSPVLSKKRNDCSEPRLGARGWHIAKT